MNTYYSVGWYGEVSHMMRDFVMERARRHLGRHAAEKAGLRSVGQVQERQARLREAFLRAIGGIPERAPDLEPAWGELRERGDYSVQNVLFRPAPDTYLTATVWRPPGWEGTRPGVLFACGHHEAPREVAEYQEICALFALNGYVTLSFDPPGQGEQKLCWDPALGASFAGSGSAEHEHCGLQCELVGHNVARYFVQAGMAAFDLLAGLPEVDPERIAVTGSSGGGTQSSYLMLADERIAAAMPCTFTTAREVYMRRPHWHDEEQNLTGALPAGLDYDDFYLAFAPKPAAIGAVTWDFFPIEGARLSYERAQHAYSLFGAEERVALFEVECGHQYHPVLRRSAIEFFNRFLQPEARFRELRAFTPEPPETQRCTRTGQVSTSLPGAKLAFEHNRDAAMESRARRRVPGPADLASLLGLPREPGPLNPRVLYTGPEGEITVEKGFLMAEADTVVPFLRLAGANARSALLCCRDDGIAGIDGAEEQLLRRLAGAGVAVTVVEPRGTGETHPSAGAPGMLADRWIPQYIRMLGTSLGALRAYDLVRALAYVRSRNPGVPTVVMAHGMVAWSAVLAAALDRQVDALCLSLVRPSIEEFALERTARLPQAYAIPGILQVADLPQLVQAAGARRVLVLEPVDALGRAISAAQWEERYAPAWKEATVAPATDSLARHAALAGFLAAGIPGGW